MKLLPQEICFKKKYFQKNYLKAAPSKKYISKRQNILSISKKVSYILPYKKQSFLN